VNRAVPAHGDDEVTTFFRGLPGEFRGMGRIDRTAPGKFTPKFLGNGAEIVGGFPGATEVCHGVENELDFSGHGTSPKSGFVMI
jgi:hypothetical protein